MDKNVKKKGKDIPMAMPRMSWELYSSLYRLREALINTDELELADKLIDPIRTFWFYSIFSNAYTLLTVAGPQGVGKSLMVNTLLNLPEDARLPVGQISCEHIPVVLKYINKDHPNVKKSDWKPVEVYQKTEPGKTEFFTIKTMSYKEGRDRAIHPKDTDMLMVWYVMDNPQLKRLSPIAVLPGLELEAPWARAIRFILDVSDVVIYTVDSRRAAQDTAAQMEEWIKDSKLKVRPITVVTKSETFGSKEKNDIEKTLSERGFSPIFIDSLGKNGPIGYDELGKAIAIAFTQVPPGLQTDKMHQILSTKVMPILKKLEKTAKEKVVDFSIEENHLIKNVIMRLDALWENRVKQRLIDKSKEIVQKRQEKALESARNIAKEQFSGFWKKIGLYFAGGPSVEETVKIENIIRKELFTGLSNELTYALEGELSSKVERIPDKFTGDEDWTTNALMTVLTTPGKDLGRSVDDLIDSLAKAETLADSMVNFLKSSALNAAEFSDEIQNYVSIIKGSGPVLSTVTAAGMAGGGAIEAAAEAAGGGLVPGSTLTSVIGGIAGLAVATVSALALYSSILRCVREIEWEVERYTRELISLAANEIEAEFQKRLDIFWNAFKYQVEEDMRERMGLNDELRNSIHLYEALKDTRDTVRDILTKIGI